MINLPPLTAPVKRSVSIDGHRTSVSLEDPFWKALAREAAALDLTRAALIGQIDHARPPGVGLATALRLYAIHAAERRLALHLGENIPGG